MFITFFLMKQWEKRRTIWIMNNLKEGMKKKEKKKRGKQCQPTKQEKEKEIKNMKRKKW